VGTLSRGSDAFEADWWRRDVAAAWVLTRDKTFVQEQFDRGERDIAWDIAFALYAADRKFSEIPMASTNDARLALYREMQAGRVRTIGEPFERIVYGNGSTSTTAEPAKDIFGAELVLMKSLIKDDYEFLVNISWQATIGSSRGNLRGYRRVRVLRSDVVAVFPEMAPREDISFTDQPMTGEAAYKTWIARHIGQTPPDRDADLDHMRLLFPGIDQGLVRDLRREHAPKTWTGKGRRRGAAKKK
jgi:hypothetical protein